MLAKLIHAVGAMGRCKEKRRHGTFPGRAEPVAGETQRQPSVNRTNPLEWQVYSPVEEELLKGVMDHP